jgi:hypothetical protein
MTVEKLKSNLQNAWKDGDGRWRLFRTLSTRAAHAGSMVFGGQFECAKCQNFLKCPILNVHSFSAYVLELSI